MLNLNNFNILEQVTIGLNNSVYTATSKDDATKYLITVEKIENRNTAGSSETPVHESLLLLILSNEERLRKQNRIFMELSSELFLNGMISDFRSINKKTAEGLDASRVSIWMYNNDKSALRCLNLYDKCSESHTQGQIIYQQEYPNYFAALKIKQIITAHDALHDERTKEFASNYLEPLGIKSILTIPIHIGSRMVGIFCIEHVGSKRVWQLEEQNFASSMADVSAIVILSKEREEAQEETLRKERFYKSLLDNAFDSILVKDANDCITFVTPSVRKFGFEPEELIGHTVFDFFHPAEKETIIASFEKVYKHPGATDTLMQWIRQKDGEHRTLEVIARNMLHDEAVKGIVINFRDITGRLEAENKLIEKEKYFRSLIENSTDIISIADRNVNFFYASPAVERILGYTMEEYLTLNGADLVHLDYKPMVGETYMHIVRHPEAQATIEFPFRHKEGHYVFLEVVFKNMLHDENVKGIVMNSRDISERKKAEEVLKNYNELLKSEVEKQTNTLIKKNEELQAILEDLKNAQMQLIQSEKMASLGQLTAGIAHEINNPINFVSANIDSLKYDFEELKILIEKYDSLHHSTDIRVDLDKVKQLSREIDVQYLLKEIKALLIGIEEGAKRTKEIVVGLRNFSRLDESEKKPANIHEGLDSTLMILRHKLKNRITVEKEYGQLPLVECYPGKLNQVFMNILTNAIQAIPGEGFIKIRTWQRNKNIFISIQDSGVGMEKNIKERIFDPFFTTKEVGTGTGLGLSISYGIIQKHNGKIEVNSQPGKGTEFIIVLPI